MPASFEGLVACPACQSSLDKSDSEWACLSCGRHFTIQDGVSRFLTGDSSHGELDREDMKSLVATALDHGWRQALSEISADKRSLVTNLVDDRLRLRSLSPLSDGGDAVLDFGCGYGGVSRSLAKTFKTVVSLDGSIDRISFFEIIRSQEMIENIYPVCHIDPLRLPFAANSFDAIVMIGVFEYLPAGLSCMPIAEAHQACLRSFFRVLKPGGKLLMHTKNRYGWNFLMGARDHNGIRFGPALPLPIADLIKRMSGRGRYRIVNYSARRYRKILQNAGFDFESLYWPYPGYQAPDYLVDLGDRPSDQIRAFSPEACPALKRKAFQALAKSRLLPYITPHLSVVAVKP